MAIRGLIGSMVVIWRLLVALSGTALFALTSVRSAVMNDRDGAVLLEVRGRGRVAAQLFQQCAQILLHDRDNNTENCERDTHIHTHTARRG